MLTSKIRPLAVATGFGSARSAMKDGVQWSKGSVPIRAALVGAGLAVALLLHAALTWLRGLGFEVLDLDALIAAIVGLAALTGFLVAESTWVSFVISAAFVNAWHSLPSRSGGKTARLRGLRAHKRRARREALRDVQIITENALSGEFRPGRTLADINQRGSRRAAWPWDPWRPAGADKGWDENSPTRRAWYREAASQLENGLIGRLMAPEACRRVAEATRRLALVSQDFAHQIPAKRELAHPLAKEDLPCTVADAVTVLSGALVLADAAHSRAGAPAACRVWHSAEYRPHTTAPSPTGRVLTPPRYEDRHALGSRHAADSRCEFERVFQGRADFRSGDFDGRLLDLRGVAVVQDERCEGVNLLLSTAETCYAATEVKLPTVDTRAKGLTAAQARDRHPRFVFATEPQGGTVDSIVTERDDVGACVVPVAAFATAVLHWQDGASTRRAVALTKRSATTRNSAGTTGPLGGGIINLSVGGQPGDEDDDGFPSPGVALLRELTEEIGIDATTAAMHASSVYLLNERGPYMSRERRRSHTGQLVATVHFLVDLPVDEETLRNLRRFSSSKGRYEGVDIEIIDLPQVTPDLPPTAAAERLAADITEASASQPARGQEHDQRAFVGLLYAAIEEYGAKAVMGAFHGSPWWQVRWSRALEDPESHEPRYLVSPLHLVDESRAEELRVAAAALGVSFPESAT